MADTTIILLAPGMGDGIQAAKAGILEVGDIYVVNKADRDGVQNVTRDLRAMLALAERAPDAWVPPILKTVASRNEGVGEVVVAIEERLAWMRGNGVLTERRRTRARDEIEAIAMTALRSRFAHLHGDARLDVLAAKVAGGGTDPYSAADELLDAL
jgi:LAO/AO transport system kinase